MTCSFWLKKSNRAGPPPSTDPKCQRRQVALPATVRPTRSRANGSGPVQHPAATGPCPDAGDALTRAADGPGPEPCQPAPRCVGWHSRAVTGFSASTTGHSPSDPRCFAAQIKPQGASRPYLLPPRARGSPETGTVCDPVFCLAPLRAGIPLSLGQHFQQPPILARSWIFADLVSLARDLRPPF